MATKVSKKQAIKDFGVRLLTQLPLHDPTFLDMMHTADLLPLNSKADIEAENNKTKKVAIYKSNVLEPGADVYLPKLLDVMDDSGDHVAQKLADDIREATGLIKCN